jgi:vacuolar-type H+-ATPase subunit E/Vma4
MDAERSKCKVKSEEGSAKVHLRRELRHRAKEGIFSFFERKARSLKGDERSHYKLKEISFYTQDISYIMDN